jgi:hypothetical protein
MTRALHIFRKDLRRLRLHIGVFLVFLAAFAVLDIIYLPGPNSATEIPRAAAEVLLTLAAWWLIVTAVHEEPLIGDAEFWLTRPYTRSELLLAKLILFGAVISLPLLLADCLILVAQGLPLFSNLGGLALRQVATSLWLIVPTFVIAALTADMAQYALGWFVAAIYAIAVAQMKRSSPLLDNDFPWSILWILAFLSGGIMLLAVWRQYMSGRTRWNRVLFALALIPPTLPVSWDTALAAQQFFLPAAERANRITIRPAADRSVHLAPRVTPDVSCVEIPVDVTGVEEGWHLTMIGGSAKFHSGSRTLKRPAADGEAWLQQKDGAYWQTACVAERPSAEHFTAEVTVVFAVMEEKERMNRQIQGAPFSEPGIGKCEIVPSDGEARLLCRSAVRPPEPGLVQVNTGMSGMAIPLGPETVLHDAAGASPYTGNEGSEISYFNQAWAPLHVLPGFSPVFKWICLPEESGRAFLPALRGAFIDISFTERKPIAFLQRAYTVQDVVFAPKAVIVPIR